jgi:hypothetical protein
VEIDETKYFHRSTIGGQWREGHWVFRRIERETVKCFVVEVENRNAATLEAIILQYVLPGTHIVSDGCRPYGNLDKIAGGIYTHSVIIHESNFVDPDNHEVHTQNTENMWMHAKRKVKNNLAHHVLYFPLIRTNFCTEILYKATTFFRNSSSHCLKIIHYRNVYETNVKCNFFRIIFFGLATSPCPLNTTSCHCAIDNK